MVVALNYNHFPVFLSNCDKVSKVSTCMPITSFKYTHAGMPHRWLFRFCLLACLLVCLLVLPQVNIACLEVVVVECP